MSNSTTNDQIRYTITIYGDVRGTCIAPLNKGAARKLREIQSRLDKNDDKYFDRISYNERLEKAVSKLKAVYSAWSYCADSFTMVVTEARKKDVLFKLHNHDPKLKITIADYYVDTIGVYIATTENSC